MCELVCVCGGHYTLLSSEHPTSSSPPLLPRCKLRRPPHSQRLTHLKWQMHHQWGPFFSPLFSSLFSLFPLVSCPGYFFLSLFPRNLLSCLLSSPLQRVVLPLAPSFLSCHMSACPCQLSQLTSRKPPLTDKHKILGNTDSFHCRNIITLQIFLRKINDEKVLYTSI